MITRKNIHQAINFAKTARYSIEAGWAQNAGISISLDGHVSYCLSTAIMRAANNNSAPVDSFVPTNKSIPVRLLVSSITRLIPPFPSSFTTDPDFAQPLIIAFNDHPDTTKSDVLTVLDNARYTLQQLHDKPWWQRL